MQLFTFKIKFDNGEQPDALYPVVIKNEHETFLVDTGYEGFLPLIEAALNARGLSIKDLTGIIITHHDIDHIGALYEIKEHYPQVKVYTSETEKDYVEGRKKSLRLEQAESLYECLPEEQKEGARQFQELHKRIKPVKVDVSFPAAENFNFLEGVRIISTPGHMPGHISIYLEESKTLIAADAVVYEDGALDIANPQFTLDLPRAIQSVKKLQGLEIDQFICYHGGVVKGNISMMLQELFDKYARKQNF